MIFIEGELLFREQALGHPDSRIWLSHFSEKYVMIEFQDENRHKGPNFQGGAWMKCELQCDVAPGRTACERCHHYSSLRSCTALTRAFFEWHSGSEDRFVSINNASFNVLAIYLAELRLLRWPNEADSKYGGRHVRIGMFVLIILGVIVVDVSDFYLEQIRFVIRAREWSCNIKHNWEAKRDLSGTWKARGPDI